MLTCFMSVPCCGCVSQTERLTNCSILLNVRVTEAINGNELIAVTHLAHPVIVPSLPYHSQPAQKIWCWADVWVWIDFCGQMSSHWIVEKKAWRSLLCCLFVFLNMTTACFAVHSSPQSLTHYPCLPTGVRPKTLNWSLVAFKEELWKRSVCVCVCVD